MLPRHLSDKARRKLIINPEELLDNVSMSESSFVVFLHQNYVDFFGNISSLADAAEYLSLSEPFFDEWTVNVFFIIYFYIITNLILLVEQQQGSISPTFYEQLPKAQKRQSSQAAFFAFGICVSKSWV